MFKRIKKTEDDPSLKEAQTFVKGWVERVVLSTGTLLVLLNISPVVRSNICLYIFYLSINLS